MRARYDAQLANVVRSDVRIYVAVVANVRGVANERNDDAERSFVRRALLFDRYAIVELDRYAFDDSLTPKRWDAATRAHAFKKGHTVRIGIRSFEGFEFMLRIEQGDSEFWHLEKPAFLSFVLERRTGGHIRSRDRRRAFVVRDPGARHADEERERGNERESDQLLRDQSSRFRHVDSF
jgi:hypothetical protein